MGDALELLELVFARPREAVTAARGLLVGTPSAFDASVAHQVIGLSLREYGDIDAAVVELRKAQSLARKSGSKQRSADVSASLGIAIVHSGQTMRGLDVLNQAVSHATGTSTARARFLRGCALWILGRHEGALADARVAIPLLRRAGDRLWTARALTLRGLNNLALGMVRRADADFATAERIFAAIDERHASAQALHNRGLVAFRSGDLPAALTCLDEVERRYQALGTPTPELVIDRCAILLTAGLAHEALAEANAEIERTAGRRGQATRRAELLLVAARAALAADDPSAAQERAANAASVFAGQRREWWHAHARLMVLQARFAADPATGRWLSQAVRVARDLERLGSPDAVQAHLLAGRLAIAGCSSPATQLAAAARARHRGSAVARVDGWVAHALLASTEGDTRRVLAACRRGLDVLDEHRFMLGASELRARTAAQGTELADLAQRACARNPRQLLKWSERWRATVCSVPAVRPPDDPAMRADLAALREVTSRLHTAQEQGTPAHALETERTRLERRIRAQTLHIRGAGDPGGGLDVAQLLNALDTTRLIEIVDLDGELHVLVCGNGRVRRWRSGRTSAAVGAIESARLTLRLLAYGHREHDRLLARLANLGKRLEDILLGSAARQLGDGPVVIVPPGRLHGVPWALLPALTDRMHAVAPSARAWLNSKSAAAQSDRVVLVHGPNLTSLDAEVHALSDVYPAARVLSNGSATAAKVLDALGGTALAHIAAHGDFRADNPLFSSIQLADGPLTVYDFERLPSAPHRIVLPVCSSGQLLPVGADELLGLTTALLPLGTAGIVASLLPVSDVATVPLMVALHESLRAGSSCAQALYDARRSVPDDPVTRATAASFVALGAG